MPKTKRLARRSLPVKSNPVASAAEWGEAQLQSFSMGRALVYSALQIGCLGVLFYSYITRQSVWDLAILLVLDIFAVLVLCISLLSRMPVVKAWLERPVAKFLCWSIPIALVVPARMLGGQWASQLLLTSPSNLPYASLVAAALILGLSLAVLLNLFALVCEIATAFALDFKSKGVGRRSLGLVLLFVTTFMSAYASSKALVELASPRFGSILLAHVAYEFDAVHPGYCALTEDEKRLIARSTQELSIKALHLSTSLETALLVNQSPAWREKIVLQTLRDEDVRQHQIQPRRLVSCYKAP